jgi:hypothetical protein
METFEHCHKINDLLLNNNEAEARNELIRLLDYLTHKQTPYDSLVNKLIRQSGLYPYLDLETADWQERFIHEAFKVDIGTSEPITLHREQSSLLKSLLVGNSIAVSAPTSFGKSFIIDAFIAIRKPTNVVLIVPTLALTDETRRRLYKKFSKQYKIITTSDVPLGEKNILIFPQERAIHYANVLDSIDILVIDEFYKASIAHDKERAASLQNAIMKLGDLATQKYFLAPNITTIKENPFTKDMLVLDKLNFNTVFLNVHKEYLKINDDEEKKRQKLLELTRSGKSLIYAALFKEIDKVSEICLNYVNDSERDILNLFSEWLIRNYSDQWILPSLVKKGFGIHNGRLHRSISQIQVKLFEEDEGLDNIISTSSIIEGVNTSAKKVILWSNKSGAGNTNLKNFTYKNIKGRGGRMFKHFVGDIYELVRPPEEKPTQLDLGIPDSLLSSIDNPKYIESLDETQLGKILAFEEEISKIIEIQRFRILQKENAFQSSDSELILKIAKEIDGNRKKWNGLNYLNSDKVDSWTWLIKTIVFLDPKSIRWNNEDKEQYNKFVAFVQILSTNWRTPLPNLIKKLEEHNISVDDFFNLEKKVCYAFTSLLNDVNVLQKEILKNKNLDISLFISKVSHAFLPPVVYQLEEYGLPRMLSKKIHYCKVIDFENKDLTLHIAIEELKRIGKENIILQTKKYLLDFDYYLLDFFFDGITTDDELISI